MGNELTSNFNFEAVPYEPVEEKTVTHQKERESSSNIAQKTKKEEEVEAQRNILVLRAKEAKECLNVVFIGHVDAGKSTIGGHLLYLTGMVDQRTLEKYEREAREKNRESWYLSWALDTNAEERDKGKTVEVGRAFFDTTHKHIIVLDAPGHRSYVPNMIVGVAQADVGVLVISARKGEFETGFDKGGQTREHAQIAKIAGVRKLVVVVNKMDDSTVNWDDKRYTTICDRLGIYLKKIGWKANDVFFMPVSGLSGLNLREPYRGCSWWNGQSLLQYLDELPPLNEDLEGPPMVLVSEKYKDMGAVCVGKVVSGCFSRNDSLLLMPQRKHCKVITILSLDDEETSVAKIGQNIKLRLLNVDEQDLMPGYVLCSPASPCPVGRVFDAQLVIVECRTIITSGFRAIIHAHTAVDEAVFTSLRRELDRKTHE